MNKQVNILLVDDDEIDRRLIKRLFKREKITNPVFEAMNGEEALAILRSADEDKSLKRPFMILLDINMPAMDGHEFLEELRADDSIKDSIVFVLSTSQADNDRFKAYEKNVAGYIYKTSMIEDFLTSIRMLRYFTLSVEFPKDRPEKPQNFQS